MKHVWIAECKRTGDVIPWICQYTKREAIDQLYRNTECPQDYRIAKYVREKKRGDA